MMNKMIQVSRFGLVVDMKVDVLVVDSDPLQLYFDEPVWGLTERILKSLDLQENERWDISEKELWILTKKLDPLSEAYLAVVDILNTVVEVLHASNFLVYESEDENALYIVNAGGLTVRGTLTMGQHGTVSVLPGGLAELWYGIVTGSVLPETYDWRQDTQRFEHWNSV